jgi:hypothetical protein
MGKSSSKNKRFHEACARKLLSLPVGICKEGFKRVQWDQANIGYSVEDELNAPGCPFGVLTEDKHSYCMFKLIAMTDEGLSYREIAKRLGLTVEQVEKTEKLALLKLKEATVLAELQSTRHQEKSFGTSGSLTVSDDADGDLYFDYSDFNVESLMELGSEEYVKKSE